MTTYAEIPVAALKAQHSSLFVVDLTELRIDNAPGYVVIKPLTRRLFNELTERYDYDPDGVEEDTVNRSIVWPELTDELSQKYMAGFDSAVANAVFACSGFSDEQYLVDGVLEARAEAANLESAIVIYICKAFPSYKPHEVEDMTFEEQMRCAALAEQVLGMPIPYEQYLNPGASKYDEFATTEQGKQGITEERLERFRERQAAQNNEAKPAPPPPPPGWESHGGDVHEVTPDNFVDEMNKLQAFLGGS